MFQTLLKKKAYVNDTVIRYYRGLLLERELARQAVDGYADGSWIYDSHFMTVATRDVQELIGCSNRVPGKEPTENCDMRSSKWLCLLTEIVTKGGNIFLLNRLIIPVNVRHTHWYLGVVLFAEKRVQIYDSLPSQDGRHGSLQKIMDYLDMEHNSQYGRPLARNDWTLQPCHPSNKWAPKQLQGGNDCGVFLCLMMDLLMMRESSAMGLCPEAVGRNGREWIACSLLMGEILV